jgi:hypothetical protein
MPELIVVAIINTIHRNRIDPEDRNRLRRRTISYFRRTLVRRAVRAPYFLIPKEDLRAMRFQIVSPFELLQQLGEI